MTDPKVRDGIIAGILFFLGCVYGKAFAERCTHIKPPAPITINVTVQKPEQVKPTIEALSKALPKLENR